jgi:hypothetical protein
MKFPSLSSTLSLPDDAISVTTVARHFYSLMEQRCHEAKAGILSVGILSAMHCTPILVVFVLVCTDYKIVSCGPACKFSHPDQLERHIA